MALRIERELPDASDGETSALYSDLVRFWSAGLLNHFETENGCLLARLASTGDRGLAGAGRMQREHREMEELVETMRTTSDMSRRRQALADFGRTLRAHVRWEERELFEWLQTALAPDDLDAVGAYLETHLPETPVACPMPHDA